MKGTDGDLLIIIWNDSAKRNDWNKYFSLFEWRKDRLKKVGGLSW